MKDLRAKRMEKLPPYLFIEMDRKKKEALSRGVDVISLAIGDPDLPTPDFIIEALCRAARDPANHTYPLGGGHPEFRKAAAAWFERRFGVSVDPQKEILALIGSKEGIAHLPLGLLDEGEVALIPDPAYPVYYSGTIFAGGEAYFLPLLEENGFKPDLYAVPEDVLRRAKILWLNYPNNPTAATVDIAFWKEAVDFAKRWNLLLINDAAYSEIYYDGQKPASALQVPGAKECVVEFHSLSKTFNMTGWRIAFAVGCPKALQVLEEVKGNIDSGAFTAVQWAAVEAMKAPDSVTDAIRAIYQERRDVLVPILKKAGWDVFTPPAAFYVWGKVPKGMDSMGFCSKVLEETGVVITPGVGFGKNGEGYFRMTLCSPKERLQEAAERLQKVRVAG